MKDRELVTLAKKNNRYKGELYFRYEKLCYKHLHILERQLNHKLSIKDDFMGDTYEVFLKALESVKITEIKNDKWLFLGWYGFYLKNLRIKYMNDIIKQSKHETSLVKESKNDKEYLITDVVGLHAPDVFQEIEDRLTYEAIYLLFTERQKKISDWKQLNFKNSEIAKKLGISNTLVTFEIQKMRDIVKDNL